MPYAPQIQAKGSDYIFEGMKAGHQKLFSYLSDLSKNLEEAKGFDTTLGDYAKQHGEDPDFQDKFGESLAKAPAMSLSQKKALTGDIAMYDQRARQKPIDNAVLAHYAAQTDSLNERTQQDRAERAVPAAVLAAAREPSNYVEQNPPPRGINPETIWEGASRAGSKIDPRVLAQYGGGDGGGAPTPVPWEDPETGQRVLLYGKQAQPTGINPKKLNAQAETVTDEDGNPLPGHIIRGPKGNPIYIRPQPASTARPVVDPNTGKPVAGMGQVGNRVVDFRTSVQKMVGDEAPPGPGGFTAGSQPIVPGQGGAPGPVETPDQIKALFKAGKLSKEDATKRLQALGYK